MSEKRFEFYSDEDLVGVERKLVILINAYLRRKIRVNHF